MRFLGRTEVVAGSATPSRRKDHKRGSRSRARSASEHAEGLHPAFPTNCLLRLTGPFSSTKAFSSPMESSAVVIVPKSDGL